MKIIRSSFIIFIFLIIASPCFAKVTGSILFVRDGDLWKYSCKSKKEVLFIKKATKPACSRDGKKLAFVRDGNIWTSDITGENQKEISTFKTDNDLDSLEWFPSGDKILFSRSEEYQISYTGDDRKLNWPPNEIEGRSSGLVTRSIWILSLNDRSIIKFIGHTPGSMFDSIKFTEVDSPKWHPDPKKMLLIFARGGDIWSASMGTDGLVELDKEERRLAPVATLYDHYGASPATYVADHLSWSPKGKWILYEIHRHNGSGTGDIYELSANGKINRKLYSTDNDCYPVYSPDGEQIAFIDNNNGGNLCIIDRKKHKLKLLHNLIIGIDRFIWLKGN